MLIPGCNAILGRMCGDTCYPVVLAVAARNGRREDTCMLLPYAIMHTVLKSCSRITGHHAPMHAGSLSYGRPVGSAAEFDSLSSCTFILSNQKTQK